MSKKKIKNVKKQEAIAKRWRNAKGQLVSYKDISNIRHYFEELNPQNKPDSIRLEIKNWDSELVQKFSAQGGKGFNMLSEQFLVDSAIPNNTEFDVKQRLAQAQMEGTKVYYFDDEVTIRELLAILQENSDKIKNDAIKNGNNWYKTYSYLIYDRINNTLTYDPNLDSDDPIEGTPTESKASVKLRNEQIEWQKKWEIKKQSKK